MNKKLIAIIAAVVLLIGLIVGGILLLRPDSTPDPVVTEPPVVETEPPVVETTPPIEEKDWQKSYDNYMQNYRIPENVTGIQATFGTNTLRKYSNEDSLLLQVNMSGREYISYSTMTEHLVIEKNGDNNVFYREAFEDIVSEKGEPTDDEAYRIGGIYTPNTVVSYKDGTEINGVIYDILELSTTTAINGVDTGVTQVYLLSYPWDDSFVSFEYMIYPNGDIYYNEGCPYPMNADVNPDCKWVIDLEAKTISDGETTIDMTVTDRTVYETISTDVTTVAYAYINRATQEIEYFIVVDSLTEREVKVMFLTDTLEKPEIPAGATEVSKQESIDLKEYYHTKSPELFSVASILNL